MAASEHPTVGFVGLGAMGFGMAANLVKQGYTVKGFDVFPKSIERFQQAGGLSTSSLAESASGCEYYICMVATALQAQAALFDSEQAIVPALPQGATLLLCSTVPSSYAQSVQSQLSSIGRSDIFFIDAPVSGGAKRAADGTLSIMAGASDAALEKGKEILSVTADTNKLYLVPGGVGQGSNMKMVHQVLAGIHILGASEAMGFAARLGLDPVQTRDAVVKSDAWSWMFENRTPRMLEEDYFPGVSALTIILKDVGIITSMGRLHTFPTPLISAAEQVYLQGLSADFGPNDDAGMVRMYYALPLVQASANSSDTPEIIAAKTALVIRYLRCLHIASAAEAIAYAHFLGIDLSQFYELACAAAGGSAMFSDRGAQMIKGLVQSAFGLSEKSEERTSTIDEVVADLSAVVQEAQSLKVPLYLGSAALNLFLLAKRRGLGAEPDACVIKVWGP